MDTVFCRFHNVECHACDQANWRRAFDADGRCIRFIEGDPRRFHLVTGVREYQGKLYAGSIEENAVAVVTLPRLIA